MIQIRFTEPVDEEWLQWRHKCDAARKAIIAEFQKTGQVTVSDLYKDPDIKRSVYANANGPFSGKCAYCESLTEVNQPGDIEHFRPKNRVTDVNGVPVTTDGGEVHPGYYWLAYDWENLLFACIDCNRPSRRKTDGRLIGKWAYFPVRGFRAAKEGEERFEEPLLIDPTKVDPNEHLDITENGVMVAITDSGQECIDVFGLNDRTTLVKARSDSFRDGKTQFTLALIARLSGGGKNDDAEAILDDVKKGVRPFSAPARKGLATAYSAAYGRVAETGSQFI